MAGILLTQHHTSSEATGGLLICIKSKVKLTKVARESRTETALNEYLPAFGQLASADVKPC